MAVVCKCVKKGREGGMANAGMCAYAMADIGLIGSCIFILMMMSNLPEVDPTTM